MQYEVRWWQPDGGCGEEECRKVCEDREEAYLFSMTLDPQTCKAIRIYQVFPVEPPKPRSGHQVTKANRQYVAIIPTASRNGYRIAAVGKPGQPWFEVAREANVTSDHIITRSVAQRSYKRAWRRWVDSLQEGEYVKAGMRDER